MNDIIRIAKLDRRTKTLIANIGTAITGTKKKDYLSPLDVEIYVNDIVLERVVSTTFDVNSDTYDIGMKFCVICEEDDIQKIHSLFKETSINRITYDIREKQYWFFVSFRFVDLLIVDSFFEVEQIKFEESL